ncbi:BfmA/BtgA family mobilization protein [Salinimicrobium sp. MT39]|uniref:BfmA/BtgA family mobilization protein n=1 Tax=Salinimicrobium profundisediminis TaxID=2994553 RepID=A0A9X3CYD1_9FLAO|nr:BfmA/BtgA family mobilization protein [Salinimicrobium profundisediminis]MCX2839068.1 BfmA/BtgA family mobilization protein [Salinimicrobium profundisediminis]
MSTFSTISIKIETARRFRAFCRETGGSNTEILELVLDYFQKYQISPRHKAKIDLPALDEKIQKRLNAIVAIIKEIEKTQTQPTLAMLQLLFDPAQATSVPSTRLPLPPTQERATSVKSKENLSGSEIRVYEEIKKDLEYILSKVIYDKRTFGPDRYVLEMAGEELERMKRKLNSY